VSRSQHGELTPLVGPAYLPLPAYGHVPDPITLIAASALIARDPAGGRHSHAEVFAGLIAAFWRGEFEARGRSVVYTLEPPRTHYRSEPGQTVQSILVAPPPGPWVDEEGRVYSERHGKRGPVSRRHMQWTRRQALSALADYDRSLGASRAGRTAIYRECARRPIEAWSDYARALIWDRLCISLTDLARWITARDEAMPRFLVHHAGEILTASTLPTPELRANTPRQTIAAETASRRWLVSLMTSSPKASPKKTSMWIEARRKWPALSRRGFERAWANALAETGASWSRAGRPRGKSNQHSKKS
jgi:hypothetical protein